MSVEKTISEIQKLFALAKDKSTQSEVETVIVQAQELMIKNNVSLDEIDLEVASAKENELHTEYTTEVGAIKWWVKDLSNIIGHYFKCTSVICERRNRQSQMGYVGLKEDVDVAVMVLKFAIEKCETCAENYIQEYIKGYNSTREYYRHITKSKCIEDYEVFIKGFMLGVSSRLEEQVKKNNWEMMIAKESLVLNYEKGRRTRVHKRPNFGNLDNGKEFDEGGNITYIDTSYKTSSHFTLALDKKKHDEISKKLNELDFSKLPLETLKFVEAILKTNNENILI